MAKFGHITPIRCASVRGAGAGLGVGMLRGTGIPLIEKKRDYWFLGLLVSWLPHLEVSWFLGFLVSKFQGFKIRFKEILECCVGSYCPHITKIAFRLLWTILMPYSRFPGNVKTDLHGLSAPVFSENSLFAIFLNDISPNHLFYHMRFGFVLELF